MSPFITFSGYMLNDGRSVEACLSPAPFSDIYGSATNIQLTPVTNLWKGSSKKLKEGRRLGPGSSKIWKLKKISIRILTRINYMQPFLRLLF